MENIKLLVAPTLYITTQLHLDWLVRSVKSFNTSAIEFDLVGFCNVLNEEFESTVKYHIPKIVYNEENNLAKSWNRAIEYGIENGYDYIILPNLDVLVKPETFKNLVGFAQEQGGVMWSSYATSSVKELCRPEDDYAVMARSMNNYHTYAMFMVNDRLFKKVGKFDEHYQAYCEDVDMEHRIGLAGETHWCVYGSPFFHLENITLHGVEGDNLREENNGALAHFLRKWGNAPRKDLYKDPFNNPDLDYTYTGEPV